MRVLTPGCLEVGEGRGMESYQRLECRKILFCERKVRGINNSSQPSLCILLAFKGPWYLWLKMTCPFGLVTSVSFTQRTKPVPAQTLWFSPSRSATEAQGEARMARPSPYPAGKACRPPASRPVWVPQAGPTPDGQCRGTKKALGVHQWERRA